MNNDYQYFCVLTGGGFYIDSLPIIALPGSYIYMNNKRFYVAEFCEPKGENPNDYDLCVYCEEVDNNIDIHAIRRDLKLTSILQK